MIYTYMNHIKEKKHMEDNFFSGIKTMVKGLLTITSSFFLKSSVLSLLEGEEQVATTAIIPILNMTVTLLSILGMIFFITGMIKFINYVRNGGDYCYSSSIFDKEKEEIENNKENEYFQLVKDNLQTMVSVDEKLIKNKETLDSLSKLNEESYIKDTTQNETFSKNNDTLKIEYVPKQKSVQTIRCSICGREKEMGGICKRCKTC